MSLLKLQGGERAYVEAALLQQAVEVLVQLHECDGDRGREGSDEHACSRLRQLPARGGCHHTDRGRERRGAPTRTCRKSTTGNSWGKAQTWPKGMPERPLYTTRQMVPVAMP